MFIDPERTRALRDFPPPTNDKVVAYFIGMVNFCAKCILNFSEHITPINLLRHKGQKFSWEQEQDKTFTRQIIHSSTNSCPSCNFQKSLLSFKLMPVLRISTLSGNRWPRTTLYLCIQISFLS